ncbi:hypothetical protein [Methylopila sp. M107]|uniref:hypothetical protein n=1 Tax=Methylopila sp. M107 TaxID=1101190 RepID=UPI00037823EA|nr:hypothetical protein [Methylopila sp. M107]
MQRDEIHWRDRLFLTIPDAASIFARSPSWIRDRAAEGRLELASVMKGGPLVVTVASVSALADEFEMDEPTAPPPTREWPRLAWINPHLE